MKLYNNSVWIAHPVYSFSGGELLHKATPETENYARITFSIFAGKPALEGGDRFKFFACGVILPT